MPTGCNIYGEEERPRGPLRSRLQRAAFSPPSSSSSFARSYFKVMPNKLHRNERDSCSPAPLLLPPSFVFTKRLGRPRRIRGEERACNNLHRKSTRCARHAIMETNVRRSIIYWKLGSGRVGNLSSLATRPRNQSLNKNQANLPPSASVYRIAFDRVQPLPRFPRARRLKNGLSSSKMIEEATLTRIGGALGPDENRITAKSNLLLSRDFNNS